jgi:ribonuclease VapC
VNVLDASALLAFLQGESGADIVEGALAEESCCGAANWSEVAQRIVASGGDWSLARALLQTFDLVVEPVTEADAEWAAIRWRKGEGLSLGDRLCLAVGRRLDATVWTADKAWGKVKGVKQIR